NQLNTAAPSGDMGGNGETQSVLMPDKPCREDAQRLYASLAHATMRFENAFEKPVRRVQTRMVRTRWGYSRMNTDEETRHAA
ncbi:MAG: hypothetical protein MUP81_05725, partial [Dehalococcoidia bacterium]|nr:hypothetical protein [Dehalococcoidia bacterium]